MLSFRRAAFAAALLLPAPAWAKKALPPSPPSYVYNESVIPGDAEARLSDRLRRFEAQTGHQFVVALFSSLDGESVEDYTNKLFREWKIGDKKDNDGLLFCVFKADRRWRVEVGYGFEGTLTDLEAADLVRSRSTSYFQAGDFDAGVFAAVEGLTTKLGGTQAAKIRERRAPGELTGAAKILIAVFVLFVLYIFFFIKESVHRSTISSRTANLAVGDVLEIIINLLLLCVGGGGGGGGGGFSGGGGSSGGGGASGDW